MNPYLADLPDDLDELSIPLLAHRAGDRTLDVLRKEAAEDSSGWPDEWKSYERKDYPRFNSRRVALEQPTRDTSRRSVREFSGDEVSIYEASHILSGARIFNGPLGPTRECPSAGRLFPVECYVLMKSGPLAGHVGYYDAEAHEFVRTLAVASDLFEDPARILGTSVITGASAFVVLTSVMYRSMRKYGARGYRYALFEAGALGQEIDRGARDLGLGTCWLGGFDDEIVADLIGVRPAIDMEIPMLLMAIGRTK